MEDGKYVDGSYWFYAPNKGAPIFFAIAFLASGCWHLWQCIHYKCFKLTFLYVICAALFVGGMVTREVGAFYYDNLTIYIVSVCLVYAAPPLYELANYYVLGRVLYFVPYHSPIHPGRVLTTFAAISLVVEVLSGQGASRSANQSLSESGQAVGHALLKAALLLQIFVAAAFLLLAGTFHRRCLRNGIDNAKVNQPLLTLYISTALLLVRTIYRTVEYFSIASLRFRDPDFDPASITPLLRYEWWFYVFEAVLMLANTIVINWRHPRRWLPKGKKTYLAKDGVSEIQGPGYKEERQFLVTLFDPFDLYGLIRGRDKKRFWDEPTPVQSQQEPEPKPQV